MRLKLKDFRLGFRQGEEGEELGVQVRKPSLRPTNDALELLRHCIAQDLALGVCQIRRSVPQPYSGGGAISILEIPLSNEHLPDRATVLARVKAVIVRLGSALKVVSPRHLKPKRPRTDRHDKPLPRLTRLRPAPAASPHFSR